MPVILGLHPASRKQTPAAGGNHFLRLEGRRPGAAPLLRRSPPHGLTKLGRVGILHEAPDVTAPNRP